MHDEFDHRRCPRCDELMRLSEVEPRMLFREPEYEQHTYCCQACGNLSRFVFELPSRAEAA
jgi:RNase P subunit RPR2